MKVLPAIFLCFAAASAFAQQHVYHGRWTAEELRKSCYIQATEPGGGGPVQFDRCMRNSGFKIGKDKSPADIERLHRADEFLNPQEAQPATPAHQPQPKLF